MAAKETLHLQMLAKREVREITLSFYQSMPTTETRFGIRHPWVENPGLLLTTSVNGGDFLKPLRGCLRLRFFICEKKIVVPTLGGLLLGLKGLKYT